MNHVHISSMALQLKDPTSNAVNIKGLLKVL